MFFSCYCRYREADIFGTKTLSLNYIVWWHFHVYININFVQYESMCMFFSFSYKVGVIALTEFSYYLNDASCLVLFSFVCVCFLFPSFAMLTLCLAFGFLSKHTNK
jgi:hypothetical protein